VIRAGSQRRIGMRDLAIMWMETHYAPFGDLLGTVRTWPR
jgi:hypothetical protein